jgi:hypothetical protein
VVLRYSDAAADRGVHMMDVVEMVIRDFNKIV